MIRRIVQDKWELCWKSGNGENYTGSVELDSPFVKILHGDDPRSGAIHAYEEALRTGDSDAMTAAIQAMDANTAWDYEERFKQILTQHKITDYGQPVKELSGGQKFLFFIFKNDKNFRFIIK